ncbi:hypothetical protein J2D69_21520 [Lysinibacillus sphaericus]|nr:MULTISPECIES: hypothetical protein [Lysinibacillus]MBE5085453.1 hypothetical protein [Bacillus thuringiensis]MBI6864009.1 hypothetical protein [Lysinibacillus fusiformis]MDM5352868.1 hypothetical protein [Lysinibacillus sphaericus]MEB7454958.1 hypothetical protein [Lysinibacillus sphaericus]QPA52345.1 hypothetical protein INQ54_20830 [Lysinibacillus sphaericus]
MIFRKILPIVAILFIVALVVSNYFNKPNEQSTMITQECNDVFNKINASLPLVRT